MFTRRTALLARFGLFPIPFLIGLVVAVNAVPGDRLYLAILASGLVLCAIGWGRLLSRVTGVHLATEMAMLLGLAFVAHLLLLPNVLGGGDILWSLAMLPVGLLGLAGPTAEEERSGPYLLALLAAFGFAALWSLDASGRYAAFLSGARLQMWLDVFVHAGVIAHLGDPRAIGGGDIALARVPFVLYHMASHAFGALPVRLGLVGPLDVVTSFWLPLGATMTALGFLALGRALAGIAGGALALLALAVIPDPSAYWLQQGFLSFHWMLETSPGTLFALPVAMMSIALLARWQAGDGNGTLLLSLLAMASCFLLRAHVFVWLMPPLIAMMWLLIPVPRFTLRMRIATLALGLPFGIAALLWIARREIEQSSLAVFLTRFMEFLHQANPPTGYDGFYPQLTKALTPIGALPIGLSLALLGMAGIWLVLLLLGTAAAALRRRLTLLDAQPFLVIGWAVLMMMLAPTPYHGDFTDFRHRGFVLVVAISMSWCAALAVRLAPALASPLLTGIGAVAALGSAVFWLPGTTLPRMAWGTSFIALEIPSGLLAAARELRALAKTGDTFAIYGTPSNASLYDEATLVLSVSGVPAYVSRAEMMQRSGEPRRSIAKHRMAALADSERETDTEAAMTRLATEHVTFVVATPGHNPAWDPEGSRAIWALGGYRLWRLSPSQIHGSGN